MHDHLNKLFDRFADYIAEHVARAWFFLLCVLIVLVWVPSLFLMDSNTSQLIINTTTTIITFLLVALLHNEQHRGSQRVELRLKELVDKLPHTTDPVEDDSASIGR